MCVLFRMKFSVMGWNEDRKVSKTLFLMQWKDEDMVKWVD